MVWYCSTRDDSAGLQHARGSGVEVGGGRQATHLVIDQHPIQGDICVLHHAHAQLVLDLADRQAGRAARH